MIHDEKAEAIRILKTLNVEGYKHLTVIAMLHKTDYDVPVDIVNISLPKPPLALRPIEDIITHCKPSGTPR